MSSDPAIKVSHISKVYDLGLTGRSDSFAKIMTERLRHPLASKQKQEKFSALDDVSFDVERGEAIGIIGRNGAGKSTLLKIISRITPPSAGYIEMVGTVGSLLEVGTGFNLELTGMENVYLNGTILGMSKRDIDRRLDAIIAFAEVDKFLDTPVKRYSSGMRVRLAFSVAAHLEPEVLIIDEVLSVGDAPFQAKCLEKMRSVATDSGCTVLFVSHNLVTVEHLCPRSILLMGGKVAFDGPTSETLRRYLGSLPRAERGTAPGTFDLAAADRSGTGFDPVLQQLVMRPGGAEPGNDLVMGDPLRIEVSVEGLNEIRDAGFFVTIGTDSNDCVFRMRSRAVRPTMPDRRTSAEVIVIDVPSLPLTPGDYHIDVSVGQDPRAGRGTIDEVHHAAEFTVVGRDVFGTGHRFDRGDGAFAVPWSWEVKSAVAAPNGRIA